MNHESASTFVRHLPCPECGSSDANSLFSDGHTYCFACGAFGGETEGDAQHFRRGGGRAKGLLTGEIRGLHSRKITAETCKTFGYMVGTHKGKTVQIAPYYNEDGKLVAQKLRFKDKSFTFLGEPKEALPFGAHAWPKTGKILVVTEGEIDALSMSQAQGNKYPVVSIGCGAGPQVRKYFARHQQYFAGFEQVVLMFDMDEPGRQASKDAAAVLGARAKIADLPLKDANEMLVAGRSGDLLNAMWRAKEYRPEGILDLNDLKESVRERPRWGLSWPFPTLTKLTFGIRTGEIYTFGAGTGIGKTDLFTETMKHMVEAHGVPIGVFSLEQSPRETATRLVGKMVKRPIHRPDIEYTDAEFDAGWEALTKQGKIYLYDSFGQNDWEVVREKIEYLHHAYGVRYFFIDHLTALAASQEDERVALEAIMAEMGGLVKQLDSTVFLISHLATPEGKPHEEGGRVTIRHFKGSRAIGYWSHFMFGLERNQQADEEQERGLTLFRVLKDRYTGLATGKTFFFTYDQDTGLLAEIEPPDATDGESYGFKEESPQKGEF